jgi:hypothetical protein
VAIESIPNTKPHKSGLLWLSSIGACEGDDPLTFVVSMNLRRRHLDESQRAIIAATLANMNEWRPGLWTTKSRLANWLRKTFMASQAAS